jgi:hypothetical protein
MMMMSGVIDFVDESKSGLMKTAQRTAVTRMVTDDEEREDRGEMANWRRVSRQ